MLSAPSTTSTFTSQYRTLSIDPTGRTARLPDFGPIPSMASSVLDRVPSPLPPPGHDLSRSSSTSTLVQYQPNFNHALPGLSTLASVASDPSSQFRAFNHNHNINNSAGHALNYTASHGATTGGPICQNCTTSTTPLWRRDEIGSVLCNACGLFLKLHGTPRPISLKTDVIKSRNRVKTAAPGQKKRSLFDVNGNPTSRSEAGTPPPGQNNRQISRKSSLGPSIRSKTNSPVSRTDTPANHHSNIAPQHLFDGVSLCEQNLQPSPSIPTVHLRHPSPSPNIQVNGLSPERPMTYDALKTRVSELEVINNLYRETNSQLQQSDENARRSQQESETRLRHLLEQSQARENSFKRRVEELEREIADMKDAEPRAKRQRLSDRSELPDPPTFTP